MSRFRDGPGSPGRRDGGRIIREGASSKKEREIPIGREGHIGDSTIGSSSLRRNPRGKPDFSSNEGQSEKAAHVHRSPVDVQEHIDAAAELIRKVHVYAGEEIRGVTGLFEKILWRKVGEIHPKMDVEVVTAGIGIVHKVAERLENRVATDKEKGDQLWESTVTSSAGLIDILEGNEELRLPRHQSKGWLMICMNSAISRVIHS